MDVLKDFHFGQLPDGSVQIAMLFKDESRKVAVVPPDLLGTMLATLMHGVATAKDPAIKKYSNLLAIHSVSGQVEHGLAIVSYGLEGLGDARLSAPLPADAARALAQALATAHTDPSSH